MKNINTKYFIILLLSILLFFHPTLLKAEVIFDAKKIKTIRVYYFPPRLLPYIKITKGGSQGIEINCQNEILIANRRAINNISEILNTPKFIENREWKFNESISFKILVSYWNFEDETIFIDREGNLEFNNKTGKFASLEFNKIIEIMELIKDISDNKFVYRIKHNLLVPPIENILESLDHQNDFGQ